MATSLGIHLQSHGFDFVLLEGSSKRYSVKSSGSVVFQPEDLQNAKHLGKRIAEATKSGKADHLVLSLPASGVVMRELSLPFSDREKVMQVLKFEIESELYHLSFDDVLADFIELSDGRATPTLLVSVLGKDRVASALEVLEGADFDPPVITLSHGSLYTALQALPRGKIQADAPLETYLELSAESSQLLVLNADGSLRGARALPMGWRELTRTMDVVSTADVAIAADADADAADADADADATREDVAEDVPAVALALGGDPSLPYGLGVEEALAHVSATQTQEFFSRLSMEVRRGLVAMGSQEGPIYLLGTVIPGMKAHLEARLGREVAPLSLGLDGSDGEEPDAVALGAAMRGVGVQVAAMNFRQEEHRYARGLERVEGPLTLALVGLIVFFAFQLAINLKVVQQRKVDAAAIYARANQKVEALNQRVQEDEEYPDEWIIKNNFAGTSVDDEQRIDLLADNVMKAKKQLDELMGESDLEMPPSCLEAWRHLMVFLEQEMSDYEGRWMIENFAFTSVSASSREEAHVSAKFGITVFSDGTGQFIGRFDKIVADLSKESWVLGSANLPNTEDASVGGAKTGTVAVKILAGKSIHVEEGQ